MHILLATAHKFWLDDRADRKTIIGICRFIEHQAWRLTVCMIGELDDGDRKLLAAHWPGVPVEVIDDETSPARVRKRLLGGASAAASNGSGSILQRIKHAFSGRDKSVSSAGTNREPTLADYFSPSIQQRFQALCRQQEPDVVLVEYLWLAYLVDGLGDRLDRAPRTLINTHDVMWRRCERFHEAGKHHWLAITEEEERAALRPFAAILAIQERDAEQFQAMLPEHAVITIGHVPDRFIHPVLEREVISLLYVATGAVPNRVAIETFCRGVWKPLREQLGATVELKLAGSICDHVDMAALGEGVSGLGFVDDLAVVYGDADIVINPVT
ncbi:MAG: hypothetical protein O3A51_13065, partial [Verrucomicrobia bacterium]|nr:hypothetical protein [Verrucomicrobiota bacterium]